MTKVRMTIHRALSELKLIDAKIEKQIMESNPVGIHQKDKKINGYYDAAEFKTDAESKLASIESLIERKKNIKSAIVQANSETRVKVGEKEMSIADAITFKSIVKFKKQLIEKLKKSHQVALANLTKNNEIVDQNVQKLLEFTFGKENVKVDAKDADAVRKPYIESNEFHLFDPIEALKKAEALETEVSTFEMEVDAALSEINSTTFIEV